MHSHKFQLFWTNDFEKKTKIVYIYIGKNLTHSIIPHPLQWRESWFEQLKYIHLRMLPQKFQRFWPNGFFFRRRFFIFILYILQCRNLPPPTTCGPTIPPEIMIWLFLILLFLRMLSYKFKIILRLIDFINFREERVPKNCFYIFFYTNSALPHYNGSDPPENHNLKKPKSKLF